MQKLLGYILLTSGLLPLLFLITSSGATIPFRELLFVICLLVATAGGFTLARHKIRNHFKSHIDSNSTRIAQIEWLKTNGERVRVTLDNSEIKSRHHREIVQNDNFPTRIETLDAIYDGNRVAKNVNIQQTYIVFSKQYGDKVYRFVSQATRQAPITLKLYLDKHCGVDLYVDLTNPANYYFDLPFA